jgi:hypothetical protein
VRVRFVPCSDRSVRGPDGAGRNVPPRRALILDMRETTPTSFASTAILIATFVLAGLAFLVTHYLRSDRDEPTADLSVVVPTEATVEPVVQRSARELAPPPRHTMHYEGGGALGSWHGQAREVWFTADIDFDRDELVATDPDGPHRRALTPTEADKLRDLATAACHQDWDQADDCTDVAYKLDIDDGGCALHAHGSCPAHEELISALYPIAWPNL